MKLFIFAFLFICLMLTATEAFGEETSGSYHCRMDFLNEDLHPVGSDEKKAPLKFDAEDRYWYSEIHFPEFGISASYQHMTLSFSNEKEYWGYMQIKHVDPVTGQVHAAEGHVPLNSELILQSDVSDFKLETITVSGLKIRCGFDSGREM